MDAREGVSDVRRGWGEFRLLNELPSPKEEWCDVPEYGLGAILSWCLGPTRTIGVRMEVPIGNTKISAEASGRMVAVFERPRTVEEQAMADDALDDLLVDAGLQPRPRGWRWYARLPLGFDMDELVKLSWREIGIELGDDRTPADGFRVAAQVVARLGLSD